LELAAMVHALKIWRHYIIGKRCKVYLDHKSLKCICNTPGVTAAATVQLQWLYNVCYSRTLV
jgi:hypothetical protein